MEKQKRKNSIRRISGALLLALVFLSVPFLGSHTVRAEAAGSYSINTSGDLEAYAAAYAAGNRNPDDTLNFSLAGGQSFVLGAGYTPIGNASRPFNGKIVIPSTATNKIYLADSLFGDVTTDLLIVDESDSVREIILHRTTDGVDKPLFAENVVSGTADADWKITLDLDARDNANKHAYSFAGVIGTIKEDAKVKVDFTHLSYFSSGNASGVSNAVSSGDVGTVCGTLKAGAELTAKVTATTEFSVTSSGANAGGLVGKMEDGSKLILEEGFESVSTVLANSGYAGGVAGYAENAEIEIGTGETVNITKNVVGSSGAGGVYGYYESTTGNGTGADADVRTFDLSQIETDFTAGASGTTSANAGGFIGKLAAENSVVVDGGIDLSSDTPTSFQRKVAFSNCTNTGGVIGVYSNNDLENSLTVQNNKVSVNAQASTETKPGGGVIGKISGSNAAYVKIADVAVNNSSGSNNLSATLIGSMTDSNNKNTGSFLDVDGLIAAKGKFDSGLVRWQNSGVVRIQGITDLGGRAYFSTAATCSASHLVGTRGNGLVYAPGSGSDAGWTFYRANSSVNDIYDWGEVLRLSSANSLSESTFFTVDASEHTVTVASPVTSIGSLADFVKTALNIQLNDQDRGSLRFASTSQRSSTLLGTDLSLSVDIDLSGTGILGLMRDVDAGAEYSGSFNGGGHTITFAVGEPYGISASGTTLTSANRGNNGYGTIRTCGSGYHSFQGLFAKTRNATVENLTIDGYFSVAATTFLRMGGLVASSNTSSGSALTLDSVTTGQSNEVYIENFANSTDYVYCGGAVGYIDQTSAGTVDIDDCSFGTATVEKRTGSNSNTYFGGAIGYVGTTGSLTIDVDDTAFGGSYTNASSSQYTDARYGGLICHIVNAGTNASANTRTVQLNNVTIPNGTSVTSKVTSGTERTSGAAGAFLGFTWLDTNVVIGTDGSTDGVTIGEAGAGSAPSISVTAGANVNTAALVYKATGYWRVNHVKVNKANISSSVSSTFGFIVNDGYSSVGNSALYLELVSDGYDIASTSISGSFSVFDEIVGFTVVPETNIEDNGQAIVSIRTAGGAPLVMTGSGCNTYQNQTSYATKSNPNTRYYYNVDTFRQKASPSDPEKLMLWSLNKYAHTKLKTLFPNPLGSTLSGNYDMNGYSYYPVDASGMRINLSTLKFYNAEIEAGESLSGGDGYARTTLRASAGSSYTQHYLMHAGLFKDYTGSLNLSGKLTLGGNVSLNYFGSGFLICGTLGGDLDNTTTVSGTGGVLLDGAKINGAGSSYAPLLVNKIADNTNFTLYGVSATTSPAGYAGLSGYAASSLVGTVGSTTASDINLNFSHIALDARTSALSNSAANTSLTNIYGTSQTIFSRATLLDSFTYNTDCTGFYNYTVGEDWNSGGSAVHAVTYGKEVTDSVEHVNKEKKYYASEYYTNPTSKTTSDTFSFSTGFLPYVYTGYNAGNKTHELSVNVSSLSLTDGCGKYNHPYVITNGGQLVSVINIIFGTDMDSSFEITLPTDITGADMWCSGGDLVFTFDGTNFTNTTNGVTATKSKNDVRKYLAGAYYQIASDIEIPSTNAHGLGASNDGISNYESPYAFRGVIVGVQTGGVNPKITNESNLPLIHAANGCVIRDVDIELNASVTVSQATSTTFAYEGGCFAYGALIGRVMGGDNILDNVGVTFGAGASIAHDSSACVRLAPVGGYIGVVVSGGVIFRHMSSNANKGGFTSAVCAKVTDDGFLYVNPIIGRVVSGYAFTESNSYVCSTSGIMQNGTKNYAIPDLDPNGNKLSVTATNASSHAITVPDGQALFVLSCIVNSGAGSAGYNASSEQAYNNTLTDPWSAYRSYACTRAADYDEVGTGALITGDYADTTTAAKGDIFSGSTKIPYIVRAYTTAVGGMYRVRSICGNGTGAAVSTITLSNAVIGAGYRGIGNNFTSSEVFRLRFKKLTGGAGATVTMDISYREYNHESGNQNSKSNTTIENYRAIANTSGFGLFNTMYQMSASSTNCIENLTLKGSVFYDIRKASDGSAIKYAYGWHNWNNLTGYYPDVQDRIEAATLLHTGGLAGTVANAVYISNVTLGTGTGADSFSVEGAKYVGGLIGYVSAKNVTVTSPGAAKLTVIGGFCAGGLIGQFYNATLSITGTESMPAVVGLTKIEVKGEPSCAKITFNDFEKSFPMFHTAGGLCGYASTNSTSKTMTVKYVEVSGGSVTASQKNKRPSDMRYKIMIGGFFGRLEKSKLDFDTCTVEGVNIDGNTCGGLIGCARNALIGTMKNITVDGGQYEIDGTNMAGGLIGYYFNADAELSVSSVVIQDYKIKSSVDAEKASAGGIFGTASLNSGKYFDLFDVIIRNCVISRGSSVTSSDLELLGIGGLAGAVSNNGIIYGHNILLDNVSYESLNGKAQTPGLIVGTNRQSTKLKLVGVSVQGGAAAGASVKPVNDFSASNGMFGSGGYVIMADYDGTALAVGRNTTYLSVNGETNVTEDEPYVVGNPKLPIGDTNLYLTGDGIASAVEDDDGHDVWGLPALDIIAENGTKLYRECTDAISDFGRYSSRLSTFNSEQGSDLADDFAVLVVEDVSRANTTEMINSYINIVANTDYDYTANLSNVYSVGIYRMEYADGTGFTKSATAANLGRDSATHEFYMTGADYDTSGLIFTLIDVKFLDPKDNTKVAYHLYVPVLVKKLMVYEFRVATGAGTNYESAWYEDNDRFGKPLMENLGSPVSVYFEFDYRRSVEEWQVALENGELYRNYAKKLKFESSSGSSALDDDTVLVLVDRNRDGKPYYARFEDAYSAGYLDLSEFRETLDDPTSAAFAPIPLTDFLTVEYETATGGRFVEAESEGAAVAKATKNGVTKLFRIAESTDTSKQHYNLTVTDSETVDTDSDTVADVVDTVESYYISFFTLSSNSTVISNYAVSTDTDLGDSGYPSRVKNITELQQGEGTARLILGNIFVQGSAVLASTNNNEEITTSNNRLTVDLSVSVGIDSTISPQVSGFLAPNSSSGIYVYQSFLLNLTMQNSDGSSAKKILGTPSCSGTYSIAGGADTAYPSVVQNENYVEFVNNVPLNEYLYDNSGVLLGNVTITASVEMEYTGEGNIAAQFPGKTDVTNREIGTVVSGSSNMGYDAASTAFSTSSAPMTDANSHLYYIRENTNAKLYFNVQSESTFSEYDSLGINPLDSAGLTRLPVRTIGVHDIGPVIDLADGYDLVRASVQLFSRADGYTSPLTIGMYMPEVALEDVTPVSSTMTGNTYVFILNRSDVEDASGEALNIPIRFTVKTGSEFESAGLTYANYKIQLTVKLVKSNGGGGYDELAPSEDTNYIIYTNARVLPDFISEIAP